MADLGAIGTHRGQIGGSAGWLRGIRVSDQLLTFSARDNAEGDPAQPSIRLDSRGVFRFRWAFAAGSRTISVRVKQVANLSPRPSLVVKANPAIGIASDVTEVAPGGTNWVTIGPASITPTSDGATWVELRNNLDHLVGAAPAFFDSITRA